MMRRLLVLTPICITLLTGCGESDIDVYLRDPGAKPGRLAPLPQIQKLAIADYNREQLNDPFSAKLIITNKSANGSPDLGRQRQPLESFALESLKMTGFIWQDGATTALIIDTNKEVHRVRVGQFLGQNFGRVTKISQNGLSVVEQIQDNAGGWTKHDASLVYMGDATPGAPGNTAAGTR